MLVTEEQLEAWKNDPANFVPCPCGGRANGNGIGQGTCDRCESPVYSDGARGGGDGHNHNTDRHRAGVQDKIVFATIDADGYWRPADGSR